MAKPIRALVRVFWPCWVFLGSSLPAPIINIRPPEIKRTRRIMPIMVKEFLRMIETKEERSG